MRALARLGILSLGCSLLAVACQLPAPRSPAPPAPPERELTICERPAKPAARSQDPKIEASFRAFALTWLEKMRKVGAAMDAPGERKQIRAEFEIEQRPTGSKLVPWVGVLHYCEDTLRCTSASAASCQLSRSTAITELFPFRAGKWAY